MRERNRRAREYSQRCWERRWNRRLWILNALMILLIIGILLWALTLPEAQEPEDVPLPCPLRCRWRLTRILSRWAAP